LSVGTRLGFAARYMALGVAALVAVTACGGSSQNPSGSTTPTTTATVKIGVYREISEAFLWNIGQFSRKYGIEPQFLEAGSYPEQLQAVAKGDTDIGIIGIPQIATMASENLSSLKVVAGYSLGGQNIVMRNDENVSNWKDLEGKTVGAPLSTGTGIMLQIALLESGADMSKVHLVQSGFSGTAELQALQSKQWDGLGFWSPVTDQAVVSGYGHYVPTMDMNKTSIGPANGVMVAGPKLLGNRTLLVNFLKAFNESLDYTRSNPNRWVDIAIQLTSVSNAVVREALKHQDLNIDIDVQAAQKTAKYGPQFGFAKTDASGQIANFIDASYLAEATGKSVSDVTKPVQMSPVG